MFTVKRVGLIILLAAIIIATPVAALFVGNKSGASAEEMQVITLWQIDSFEGGKGSRAQFLQGVSDDLFKGESTYITVDCLSADAARDNINRGTYPDMISYGAGFYGIEGLVNSTDYAYKVWCRGGYCLLTIDNQADFTDADATNTVINGGKDNLVSACALFEGLNGAVIEKPTGAYVSLLNGKYKYLLGTQRDIFRLNTRGAQYKVKPVTSFNDLYQSVSILAKDKKYTSCKEFVDYLTSDKTDVGRLGLFIDGVTLYDDGMHQMENLSFAGTLRGMVSERFYGEVCSAVKSGDLNLLKSLIK